MINKENPLSTIFKIDDDGNITELASYQLLPYDALKAAYLQFIKNYYNTWMYDHLKPDIQETKNGYVIFYGENSALYVKNNEASAV